MGLADTEVVLGKEITPEVQLPLESLHEGLTFTPLL